MIPVAPLETLALFSAVFVSPRAGSPWFHTISIVVSRHGVGTD